MARMKRVPALFALCVFSHTQIFERIYTYGFAERQARNYKDFIILIISFCCFSVYAQSYDFIILKNPAAFTLYDQYEQPVSKSDAAALPHGIPFAVVKKDHRLGDRITRVMQCSYDQKAWFILEDEQGGIVGDKSDYAFVKNCSHASDTFEIASDNVEFSDAGPSGPFEKNHKGDELVLFFCTKGYCYAMKTGIRPVFGWIPASSRQFLKHVRQMSLSNDTILSEQTVLNIKSRIETANKKYMEFFAAFNRSTGMHKTIPKWIQGGNNLAWNLCGPYNRTAELDSSTKCLVEDLNDILIGKKFMAVYKNEYICIVKTAGRQ
jgi:hypothetical protein